MDEKRLQKAAERGEPSHIWRAGQERRMHMIEQAAGSLLSGRVLVDGCGVGQYLGRLAAKSGQAVGLDIEHARAHDAHQLAEQVLCAAGENLPFDSDTFDMVLSHEVLEHVDDDHKAVSEILRVLKAGGRLVLFVPNRGYPFETHGIYWRGKYHFGNIALVNYLPRRWRGRLAPHVRVYSSRDLEKLFDGLPVKTIRRTIIYGAYDNLIVRFGLFGRLLRLILQAFERTPLRVFGLSHFWVVEKIAPLANEQGNL
jgi:SAM-dependent methyltransferase